MKDEDLSDEWSSDALSEDTRRSRAGTCSRRKFFGGHGFARIGRRVLLFRYRKAVRINNAKRSGTICALGFQAERPAQYANYASRCRARSIW